MSKLNSTTKHAPEEGLVFPCLREHKNTGAIFLFSDELEAVILSGVQLGSCINTCTQENFKPFHGDVIITQE